MSTSFDRESATSAGFYDKRRATRDDLFRELDYLTQDLHVGDALLREQVRRRITRIRALASTLLPKEPSFPCDFVYEYEGRDIVCGIRHGSRAALELHQELVHGIVPSDAAA